MKKFFITFFLLLCIEIPLIAQEQDKDDISKSKSKAIEFLKADGSFLLKEYYDLLNVKGVECQVLIMNNIASGTKIGCLRLETHYKSNYSSDSYIGTLDSDELDACIQSMKYIKEILLPSVPETYTEAEYKTNDGVKFGAYYVKNKWTAYVYTQSYTGHSAEFLSADNIDTFISVMEAAKVMISEKTK